MLQATIQVKKHRLETLCVHFFPPLGKPVRQLRGSADLGRSLRKTEKLRIAQAKYLLKRLASTTAPILLIGDLNEGRHGKAIGILNGKGFSSACKTADTAACGPTYPASIPGMPALFEIDPILGKGIRFSAVKVLKGGASEHFPKLAIFLL